MQRDGSFARATVLATAFKKLASGRVAPVRGRFRDVRISDVAFSTVDGQERVSGRLEVDLASLTTDRPERDANVLTHLFGGPQTIVAELAPGGTLTPRGSNTWTWDGFVAFSLLQIPVRLRLERRRFAERTELSARLERPIDLPITQLGFPFRAFLEAVGIGSVVDRVELDVGIVVDEQAAKPRQTVVIAGGGIAGLATAQVLVDAGFDVTVLEKERFCGGKLTSHVDETLGHTVEHGIHGVFPRYQNLTRLWRDAGIGEEIFADTTTVGVASPSGMTSGRFHEFSGQAPLFLWEMLPDGVFRNRDAAACAAFLGRVYAASGSRETLDRETFQGLLDRYGVKGRLQRFLLHPYVRNLSYARPDQVSAAAACDALAYYLLEDADDFKARWFAGGPQEVVIEPWVSELALRGVRFLMQTPIQFVVFEDGRFHGFATRAILPERRFGNRDRCWVQRFGTRVVALRWKHETSELRAWDGRCTHAECPLQPAGEHGRDGFRCDCHGGAFDADGRVVRAPPTRDLTQLRVVREEAGGEAYWKMDLEPGIETQPLMRADYGVVALDIDNARRVLTPALLDLPSTRGIAALRTTPVMVLRMWFRGTSYAGPDSGFFSSSDLLDNFFVLNRFQREFQDVEGFTVVECHIGDCSTVETREDGDVLIEAVRCLTQYFPVFGLENLDAERSRVLRHQEGFPLFAPGDLARAPAVAADDRPNLLFAGDWVRSDVRSWYMERAAVTGIEAANHILAREGLATRRVLEAAEPTSVVMKLMAFPFQASDAIGRAYRAVSDDAGDAEDERKAPARRSVVVDLAELLDARDLDNIHPFVRQFYADPRDFETTAQRHLHPLVARIMNGFGSPLHMLQSITDEVTVVGGLVRERIDGGALPMALYFRASRSGDGIRFELVRGTPNLLFAAIAISYETSPTWEGTRTIATYRHKLLDIGGTIEFRSRHRAPIPAPEQSEVRLRTVPAATSAKRRSG